MKKFFYGILKTLWTATIVLVCLFAFDYFYTRKKIEDGYSPYVQTYTASNISIENVGICAIIELLNSSETEKI